MLPEIFQRKLFSPAPLHLILYVNLCGAGIVSLSKKHNLRNVAAYLKNNGRVKDKRSCNNFTSEHFLLIKLEISASLFKS
jgi:cell division protein FtsL